MVLTGPGKMSLKLFDLPPIGSEDGLLQVELVGVCGSDPAIFAGKITRGPRPYPIILGHEIVGRIVAIGDLAKKRWGVAKGDRAVIEYSFGCGTCLPCLSGSYNLCEEGYAYGSMISCKEPPHLFGGYSEYVYLHPRAMVHKIGDEISPQVGVLICAVLGNAVRWLRQVGGVSFADPVVIIGPGQQGIAGAVIAKEAGAHPVILLGLSRDKNRLQIAQRFGADRVINIEQEDPIQVVQELTNGQMGKVVMDVSGNPAAADLAISLTGKKGRVIIPGLYKGQKVALDLDQIVRREIKIYGVLSHDFRAVTPAIQLARKGKYPFAELITHCLPLTEAEKGLALVAGELKGEEPIKVVLNPNLA